MAFSGEGTSRMHCTALTSPSPQENLKSFGKSKHIRGGGGWGGVVLVCLFSKCGTSPGPQGKWGWGWVASVVPNPVSLFLLPGRKQLWVDNTSPQATEEMDIPQQQY